MECGQVQTLLDAIASLLRKDVLGNTYINIELGVKDCDDDAAINCNNNHLPPDSHIANAFSTDLCGHPAIRLYVPEAISIPITYAYRSTDAETTLDANDYQLECTANSFDVHLPTAVGIIGKVYGIKNTGTGIITVDCVGAETIDGETEQEVNQWDNLLVMSNGTNWIIR